MTRTGLLRRSMAIVIAVVATLLLRWGSLAPWSGRAEPETAVLRVAWTAQPERIERCRRLSDDEFNALPQHMRLRWSCEGVLAQYLMRVVANGEVVDAETLRGGGLRHDRPIHVLHEFQVPAGALRVEIEIARIDSAGPPEARADDDSVSDNDSSALRSREVREGEERTRRARAALPARVALDTVIVLGSARVAIVTYDAATRRLALRTTP